MKKTHLTLFAALLAFGNSIALQSCSSPKGEADSTAEDFSQFVNITDVLPDVILEIRYYGTYNFVGTRIDGYEQPVALLTRQAADSLKPSTMT